jgi:DNA repair protein RecN (Recombination protein N)
MLAIKTILARVDEVPTLVFDEIDTGIDGQTSCKIAEKLKHISKNHQVICITHMPQIASFADHHLYVEKKVAYGRTTTSVRVLEGEDKIMELANMLGGISETSIKHAQQLIDMAKV